MWSKALTRIILVRHSVDLKTPVRPCIALSHLSESTTIIGIRIASLDLDCPAVSGEVAGARLGVAEHIAENARVSSFQLGAEDLEAIESVLRQSRHLHQLIGDCGDEYRR